MVAAALAGLVAAPVAGATYLGHNGRIAYERPAEPGASEVWTMDADGSNQARFAAGSAPSWSADGRRLAWGCRDAGFGSTTCIANADGSGVRALDNHGMGHGWPVWSPDGEHLAVVEGGFCSSSVCLANIWRIDSADGGDQIQLRSAAFGTAWSGLNWIAFHPFSRNNFADLWTMPANRPDEAAEVPNGQGGGDPDWSPDGQKLVFASTAGLEVIDRDGSNRTPLTSVDGGESGPVWSPDGTKVAFARAGEIWVMDADGGGQAQLTDTPDVSERAPAWQPAPQPPYPHPMSAGKMRVSLVPASRPCTEPNRTHGPPLASGSCAPPQRRAGFMSFGSARVGAPSGAVGSVRIRVLPGDPDSVNRADVKMAVSLTDVRRGSDLADGPGHLEFVLPMRITDKANAAGFKHDGTTVDFDDYETNPLRFLVPCTETADPTVGSTCAASTTANALFPHGPRPVNEGLRAIWALDQLAVWDGGADGWIDSRDDNTILAVQGVFVP